ATRSSAGGWQRIAENSPACAKDHSIFQNHGARLNAVKPQAGIFGISDNNQGSSDNVVLL
ncbi:MAG: hypothetical protein IJI54_08715, partial [Kiritimatiellae bacterium]|nr:hypothetical protein [Kiritimatiellia bacterium]